MEESAAAKSLTSYEVFVSYRRKDHRLAERVVRFLQAHGWTVYWDQLFPPGEPYQEHLKRALEQLPCIVVLWTPHSIDSEFVIDEARYGVERNALVSVVVGRVELPDLVRGVQYVSWPRWGEPSPDALLALVAAIAGKLGVAASKTGPSELPRTQASGLLIRASLVLWLLLVTAVAASWMIRSQPSPERSHRKIGPDAHHASVTIHGDASVADTDRAGAEAQIADAGPNVEHHGTSASGTVAARSAKHCTATETRQARASAQQALLDGRQADAERELGRACDCDDAEGCFRLGKLLHHGNGTQGWDHPRALTAYRRACDLGNGDGCEGAATLYLDNDVPTSDPRVVAKLFVRACDKGVGDACTQVGRFYDRGSYGLPTDAAAARKSYERGCELGSRQGCLFLASATRDQDPAVATALYEKACTLGDADGCFQAGWRYARGAAAGSDAAEKGAGLLRRACELGRNDACKEGG